MSNKKHRRQTNKYINPMEIVDVDIDNTIFGWRAGTATVHDVARDALN